MKRSAQHLGDNSDDRKRSRIEFEWEVPTTALLIEDDDNVGQSARQSKEEETTEETTGTNPSVAVDATSHAICSTTIDTDNLSDARTNREGETPSSAPFIIVVNSERNFRVIRIYTCLRQAIVEQCVPATFLARISNMKVATCITVFGDRNISTRIKKFAPSGTIVNTIDRYENDDSAYVTYVLNKNTKLSKANIEAVRIVNLQTSDGCSSLCATTATQLGLLTTDNRYYGHGVEPIVNYLCGGTGIKFAKEFLRDLLCDPPPRSTAKAISEICKHLSCTTRALPTFAPKKSAEVYSQILQSTCSNIADIKDISTMMSALHAVLSNSQQTELIQLLQPVVNHFCSLSGDNDLSIQHFRQSLTQFRDRLISVIPAQSSKASEYSCCNLIDRAYFAAMEKDLFWEQCDATRDMHKEAKSLVQLWEKSVAKIKHSRLVLHTTEENGETNLVLVSNEDGKQMQKSDAIIAYQNRYENVIMQSNAMCAMMRFATCAELDTKVLQRAWYWLVILQALQSHVKLALQQKWTVAHTSEASESMHLVSMWPYWLKRKDASEFNLQLDGTTVLTGANKSGKSVLLRSVCAVALLANCGLMVPCDEARVPQFDKIFLKTSSFDLPHENKSTFTVTTEDLACMSNTVTKDSLVLFDDFGDGTFADDALFVAAGTLTFLKEIGTTSIIATHMRQILDLLPNPQHFSWKTMEIIPNAKRVGEPLHAVRDGVCKSSMAFSLLRQANVNSKMLYHIASFMKLQPENEEADNTNGNAEESMQEGDPDYLDMITEVLYHEIYCAESGEKDIRHFQCDEFEKMHKICLIQPSEQAPPCFTNSHFVYLRRNIMTQSYYVGETDNIQRRVEEHRKDHGSIFVFNVVGVPNKSVALRAETEIIRAYIRRGVRLDSECDGNNRNGS